VSDSPEKKKNLWRYKNAPTGHASILIFLWGPSSASLRVGARKLPIITELNVITFDGEVTVAGIIFLAQKQ
jgi:hypothetical protein